MKVFGGLISDIDLERGTNEIRNDREPGAAERNLKWGAKKIEFIR